MKRRKPGRPTIGARAMTAAERQRRHRGQSIKPVGKALAVKQVKRVREVGPSAKEVRERALAQVSGPLGALTPEEVDPELWAKSIHEYYSKYGRVPQRTKAQVEQEKFDNGLEHLLAWVKRLPTDVVTARYLQGWIDGGKPPKFRRDKLAKDWPEVAALYQRLAALIDQSGKPSAG